MLDSNKEMKAFKGSVSRECMKGLLKIKMEDMVDVVM